MQPVAHSRNSDIQPVAHSMSSDIQPVTHSKRSDIQQLQSRGFESLQERRENFLLQGQLSVMTLFRYPFHPRVTAVARLGELLTRSAM